MPCVVIMHSMLPAGGVLLCVRTVHSDPHKLRPRDFIEIASNRVSCGEFDFFVIHREHLLDPGARAEENGECRLSKASSSSFCRDVAGGFHETPTQCLG